MEIFFLSYCTIVFFLCFAKEFSAFCGYFICCLLQNTENRNVKFAIGSLSLRNPSIAFTTGIRKVSRPSNFAFDSWTEATMTVIVIAVVKLNLVFLIVLLRYGSKGQDRSSIQCH